jgi:hypothetical protein
VVVKHRPSNTSARWGLIVCQTVRISVFGHTFSTAPHRAVMLTVIRIFKLNSVERQTWLEDVARANRRRPSMLNVI